MGEGRGVYRIVSEILRESERERETTRKMEV
jgi:hypothetical protein